MLGKAHISLLLEETKFYDCKKIETENNQRWTCANNQHTAM